MLKKFGVNTVMGGRGCPKRLKTPVLEGHLSPLHSHLAQESCMFRKSCKINVSSTFKKHVSRIHGCFSHVFKWKNNSVIGFRSFVLNYTYMRDAVLFLIV